MHEQPNNLARIITIFIIVLSSLLITFIFAQSAVAQSTIVRDVEIKVIVDKINIDDEYSTLFRAENLDHQTGTTDLLHFSINATLTDENKTTKWNVTRTINKYTETGMGSLKFENQTYDLCVTLTPLNFEDLNLTNNYHCKTLSPFNLDENIQNMTENQTNNSIDTNTTIDVNNTGVNETNNTNSSNVTNNTSEVISVENETTTADDNICNCQLQIITDKNIYLEGDSISFLIKDCFNTSNFKEEIEYWAEDLFSDITKAKITTTSKSSKSYTPHIDATEKTFILNAKFVECNDTFSKLVSFKKNIDEQKTTDFILDAPSSANPDDIITIDLEGYKAKTLKTLIKIHLELQGVRKSEIFKAYALKQNSDFHFKIPLKIPQNLPEGEFEYDLIAEGLGVVSKQIITINTPKKDIIENIKITSFYTLKKKFDGTLNAKIKWQGTDEATIKIITQNETKQITTTEKTMTLPLKINKPDEIIIAELIKDDETQDIQLLKLNLDVDDEIIYKTKPKTESDKINKSQTNKNEDVDETNDINNKSDELYKTDETYKVLDDERLIKSNNTQTKITARASSFVQENKKQATIFAILVISILFLFKKEITKQIKKLLKK